MSFPRRCAVAFALIPALGIAAAGCSSSSSSNSSGSGSADPLSGMSGTQVAAAAASDLKSASQFSISGHARSDGQNVNLDLGFKPPASCAGTIGLDGKGSIAVVKIGSSVWMKPDDTYWKSVAGSEAQQEIGLLGGKYLKITGSGHNMAGMAKMCDVNDIASSFTQGSHISKGAVTTINGQRALPLTGVGQGGTTYVTDTSAPRILQATSASAGNGGMVTFGYGPVAVTAPPAGETVDGSKYGF